MPLSPQESVSYTPLDVYKRQKASFMFGIFPSLSTIPARDAVPTSVPMVSNISLIQNVMMCEIAVNHPILMKSLKSNLTSVVSVSYTHLDYSEKLTAIIQNNNIQSVTIVRMEVPCCGGLEIARCV